MDKHQSVLEVETVFIDGCGQACPIYRDNFALSSQYLKEKDRNILIFSMRIDLAMGINHHMSVKDYITNY